MLSPMIDLPRPQDILGKREAGDHPMEYWWRADITFWAEDDPRVVYTQHWIKEHTSKGVWVGFTPRSYTMHNTPKFNKRHHWKWVSKHGRKRYCYPTKAEALNSLKHRTRWRLGYARTAFDKAMAAYKLLELEN